MSVNIDAAARGSVDECNWRDVINSDFSKPGIQSRCVTSFASLSSAALTIAARASDAATVAPTLTPATLHLAASPEHSPEGLYILNSSRVM